MELCIVKSIVDKMKQDIKDGKFSFDDLLGTSPERHAILSRYMEPEVATKVNTEFEIALASSRKDALTQWATDFTRTSDNSKPAYENMIKKIDELEKTGILQNPVEDNFLYDLVHDKMGVSLTPAELMNISGRAEKLQKLSETRTETGNQTLEYWKEKGAMDDYIKGLNPSHGLKIASSVVGRANLLGLPSAVVNVVSNMTPATTMAIVRRAMTRRLVGLNPELAGKIFTENKAVYDVAGIDRARLNSLNNPRGELRLGESVTHTQGEGILRKASDVYSDIIYKYAQGYPDAMSAQLAYSDALDLFSSWMAGKKGFTGTEAKAKAAEYMVDANRIDALTPEGQTLRKLAVANSLWATYTEDGGMARFAMGIRNIINERSGDLMLGEFSIPFIKQPSNALQRTVEATGIGATRAIFLLKPALRAARSGDSVPLMNVARLAVESGFGLSIGALIVFSVNPDDFIPDYSLASPKERNLVNMKNATYNSIKLGGHYISLDYFGVLAAPITGWMYARKFGGNVGKNPVVEFGKGVIGSASRLPGLSEVADFAGGIIQSAQENTDIGKTLESKGGSLVGSILARIIPQSGTISNIDKGTDVAARQGGNDFLTQVTNAVPFLRRTLPAKINEQTGEEIKNENLASLVILGSRLKTAADNPVLNEIVRLSDLGFTPAISSVKYASGKMQDLSTQLTPEEFNNALRTYGETFNNKVTRLLNEQSYKNADAKTKMEKINSARQDSIDTVLRIYKYKPTPKEKTTVK